jgi:hypothetical protein
MTQRRPTLPPSALLRAAAAPPQAATVQAEVRTDASLPFDPDEAPDYLVIEDAKFGALVLWRVELSWADAQDVQLWLIGAPGPGSLVPATAPANENTRENALSLFVENLNGPAGTFAEYVGTYLESEVSHASYTVMVGIRTPISRQDYQAAWLNAIAALPAAAAPSWRADLVDFLRMILGRETSEEKFLQLASNIGDLTQLTPAGTPLYPMIHLLIT